MNKIVKDGRFEKRLSRKQSFLDILCFANDYALTKKLLWKRASNELFMLTLTAFKSIRLSYKERRVDA